MLYVIGESNYSFIQIRSSTMWDGYNKFWNEVDGIQYDCSIQEATIINGYEETKKILREIQDRVSEIDFTNISVIGQLIDEKKAFNKSDYAEKLKIFRLVPTLVND